MKGIEIGIKNHHQIKILLSIGPDTFLKAIKIVKEKTNILETQKLGE